MNIKYIINNIKSINMSKFQICGCYYTDSKGKSHNGIHILSRRTNTFVILNKKLEKVTDFKLKQDFCLTDCGPSEGCNPDDQCCPDDKCNPDSKKKTNNNNQPKKKRKNH